MKKNQHMPGIITLLICLAFMICLSGCNKDNAHMSAAVEDTPAETLSPAEDKEASIPDMSKKPSDDVADAASDDAETSEGITVVNEADDTMGEDTVSADTESDNTDEPEENKEQEQLKVVWLGDSLTQGSLGDDNNNVDNPQAPWRVLAGLSGWDVKGYGYYAYYAHDILWKYISDGGTYDPSTVYVFWVGSCDFHDSPDNTDKVIAEIDNFLSTGNLNRYLVMGTTDRHDMDPDAHIGINRKLADRYGDKYIDIISYIEYGPDGVHLTADSYGKIASAVYDKLKNLYAQ